MVEPLVEMSAMYDLALSIEVIEHVEESEIFIKNIAKVLKPNGIFYLTTPNGDYIKNEPPNYNPDHVKHYTKKELMEMKQKEVLTQIVSNINSIYKQIKTNEVRPNIDNLSNIDNSNLSKTHQKLATMNEFSDKYIPRL